MDALNVEKSGEFAVNNDVDKSEMSRSSFFNHRESDDDVSVDFNDKVCERMSIFFRNSLEDDVYQDELFLENPDESGTYPEDKILENKDPYETASFSKNQSDPLMLHINRDSKMISTNISSEIAESLDGSKVSSKNHHKPTVRSNLKDQGILSDGEHCNESEDSIFESVSVAYENRMKNLENVKQEPKKNVASDNCEEELDMIDDKLVRELLEFTIGEQHPNTTTQHFAASKIFQSPSSNLKNPLNLKAIPTKQRHASPNTLRLRESQKKLESMLRKFNNETSNKKNLRSLTPKSKGDGSPESQHRDLATSNPRKIHPRKQAGTAPTPHLEKERCNSAKRPGSSNCSTPRPAFRAGSMMDFSRKLDEDGRRKLAGKNNPYWKLRPRSSHKTSYIDEMLFGTGKDTATTWQAPWQPKSKPVRPHFCDWVWDRRKSPKT